MISKLNLKNFAAFKELDMELSPKINVIIGENSCGKTQLLKAIHCLSTPTDNISDRLIRLFKPRNNRLSSLYFKGGDGNAEVSIADASDRQTKLIFGRNTQQVSGPIIPSDSSGVLIPTKEVVSLLPAIASGSVNDEALNALFDDSVVDICHQLLREPAEDLQERINKEPRLGELLPALAVALHGRYVLTEDDQYFVQGTYQEKMDSSASKNVQAQIYRDNTQQYFKKTPDSEVSLSMTAEGYRKVGVLQRLLENGSLMPGSSGVLLWDEPEANINPILMQMLVECLVELSRNGQQIVIATHNYVLLKWFDLLINKKKGDHILFHALSKSDEGLITLESSDNYKQLHHNAIADTYSQLYDAEIERSLGSTQ